MAFITKKLNYRRTALILLALIANLLTISAQVTIGSSIAPHKDALLDLKQHEDGSSDKGLLLPRVALVNENDPEPLSEHVEGMYVFNTTTNETLAPGAYYNNGLRWNKVKNMETDAWNNAVTKTGATSINDDIYHIKSVAIGTVDADPSALLHVSSTSRGALIPRMSLSDRNKIASPANGLMIYNTTSNCLNYYNSSFQRWLSLCGTFDPSKFEILNCNAPTGPSGHYIEGIGLGNQHLYTLKVNVSDIGPYEVIGQTTNGYAFFDSGMFTAIGEHQLTLKAQGTPLTYGSDELQLTFNGIRVTPTCALPKIEVESAATRYTIECPSMTVYGDYYARTPLNSANYITVKINVTSPGETILETTSDNGIRFSSNSITVEPGEQTIKLFGRGTPINVGVFSGNQLTVGATTCSPTITVASTRGTFVDPANTCQEILDETPTSEDGYYWIRDQGGASYMTYCDMEPDGAWTLVKSLSERQILVVEKSQSESIGSQGDRNKVTMEGQRFNEYAFSLNSTIVNNIGNTGSGSKKFRFTIKEKGHTTNPSAAQVYVAASTVSPSDDLWAKENYWNVTIFSGNPATGNFNGKNYVSEGKLFGLPWGKPVASSNDYYFNGTKFRLTPPGMYSQSGFFTGFYGAVGYVSAGEEVGYSYYFSREEDDPNRHQIFKYNKKDINDLFGLYMNTEPQLNHHIGTCSNSNDDFGGASSCARGWSSWRPHRFNQRPDGTYEGRIIQYWVK